MRFFVLGFFSKQLLLVPLEVFLGLFDLFASWLSYKHFKMTLRCLGNRGVAPKTFS